MLRERAEGEPRAEAEAELRAELSSEMQERAKAERIEAKERLRQVLGRRAHEELVRVWHGIRSVPEREWG